MIKLFRNFFILTVSCQLLATNYVNAQIGTWTQVATNAPHRNMGVMLLLTDGTVICHNNSGGGEGTGWDKLTPDSTGSYVNGTWSSIASMNNDRLFFSSQVLPSGRVYVGGGEYGSGDTAGEVYDPVANSWTRCGAIPNGWQIYDGNSEILYNGNVLEGPQIGAPNAKGILTWSPTTLAYTQQANAPLNHDEAAWLKLPDSSVLYIGINSTNSCRYRPQKNTWVTDATVPNNIYDQWGEESGCATMLPNGQAIFFGSTQYNEIYTPSGNANPGTWTNAANFPTINGAVMGQVDAPGAMMVNGHILLGAGPGNTGPNDQFRKPLYFLEYDYISNTFTQVTSVIPGIGADSMAGIIPNFANFLDLPDGTVLMGIDQEKISKEYWVYTPGSAAIPQGKPTINNILPAGCPNYKITGKLFNGISEGACFGDDWQESTNYPLVRLTNGSRVYYAKTTNWNRIGAVQTDSLEDTVEFAPPAILAPGTTYTLVVVVNGFASNPTLFTTLGVTMASNTNVSTCYGVATASATATSATGGISPYVYSWAPSGGSNLTASNLSGGTYTIKVTDKNGCTATASVVITQPAGMVVAIDSVNLDSTGGACNGVAMVNILSGGKSPYTYLWSPGGATNNTIDSICSGTYCCSIIDNNGCTTSACVAIRNVTGIQNISLNSDDITVYPDPNNGSFTVAGVTQGQIVELYNGLGQKLSSYAANNTAMYFNISAKADGLYLLRILNKDGSLVTQKKVIKMQ